MQCLDEIHPGRYPWFFRIQYGSLASLRNRRSLDWVFEAIRGYCLAFMGWSNALLLLDPLPCCLSIEGLRLEIVSSRLTAISISELT
jgi:hypothetical protein